MNSQDASEGLDTASQDKQGSGEKDSPEAIQKREEWFYKQRASVNGRIPAGARLKALQHMQRMMVAEGKLVLRSDGSNAATTPQSGGTSFPAWTSIGPTPTTGGTFSPVTGRITTIAVDPSDATGNTVLIGGAQGGIWRSTDAGVTWTPVGDQNTSLAMGSIAFAPSSPATVYAGTGEQAAIGFDIYYGAGVLKSTDHGQTWAQTCTVAGPTCPFIGPYTNGLNPGFGFFNFGGAHISYVAVNPTNPNLILVGAQFIVEGPEEGVYCSSNGGMSWTNILPDEMATFVGFANSTTAFVALGNPFGSSQGAPNGNGIYKSVNASSCSATFTPLAGGLPAETSMGRMDLGISPNYATDNTVFASIADASNSSSTNLGVWVTINGGTTWTQTTAPDVCQQQCWYDDVVKVDPNNKNIAFFGGAAVTDSSGNPIWVVRTTTGGTSWSTVIPNQLGAGLPHVDTHALAFFKLPSGKVRLYLGNDGGIWRTDDAEASTIAWTNLNDSLLTLTQFYPSISINTSSPSIAFGGTQDNGSQNYESGTSWVDNNLCGDGGSTAVDAVDPSTVYIGCATGSAVNASYQNGVIGTFSPAVNGINPSDAADFIPPLATDPNTANVLYFGTTKIYQSFDAANTWTALTAPLVSAPGDVLTTIAVEPGNPNVVYTGSSGGEVFAAQTATTESAFFQVGEFPIAPRAVTGIAIDSSDPAGNTAYVSLSGFAFNGTDPLGNSVTDLRGHIFKTSNANSTPNATFQDVSCSAADCSKPAAGDLPNIPVNDIVLDPDVPGTIYAATDLGVYVGSCTATSCTWSTLGTALPNVAVLSLRLHEASRTLFAATHGRGVWNIALNNFAFSGPRIFSLTPTSANAGGAQLTLTAAGTGLTGGTIMFGSTALVATGASSDTSLSGTVPSALLTAGSVKVTVAIGNPNPTATSNALPFSVLALTPTLTSISPASTPVQTPPSPPATNIPIQLTGTNFASSAKVLFNGAPSGITTTFNSSTSLRATLPSALLGPYGSTDDIAVLNAPPGGGKSTPVTFKIVAPPPVNDNFANAINITSFTYTDVRDSSGATAQSSDPTPPPTCVTQYSSEQGNIGGLPNGAYDTIWYQFTPTLSSNLEVDTIGSSYDTVLSIWTGAAGVFTSVACNDDINPGIVTQSQLSAVPMTAGTTYYIMVSSFGPPDPNPLALGGRSQLNFTYNNGLYPTPTITSISPTSANSGDPGFTLTVNGTNFFNGAGVDFVNSTTFYGNSLITTYISPTQLTASVPASSITLPGTFNVSVVNPAPNYPSSNTINFTVNLGVYPVPTLTSIAPTTVVAGSFPFQIIAAGKNFASGAVLNFNGVAKTTTGNNTLNVDAIISTADIITPGTVQVTVTNPTPGGGTSAPQPFVITQPTVVPNITSVNPATVVAGFPVNLTINGTGFTQNATLSVGGLGGNFYSTNFVSSTQLSIPNFAANGVGTFPVYVIDPAPAGTSPAFNLTVTQPPAPTIASISPTSAQTGAQITLTINGSNFQPGANILFNNQSNFTFNTNYNGATQLTTSLILGGVAAGTYPITVVNVTPTSVTSNSVNFTVTGPPDFSFSVAAGQGSQTVTAGQTATFTNAITVNAVNGFTGLVNVSCTSPAQATTCALSQNSLMAAQSATVMVTTTARSLAPPLPLNRRMISWPRLVPIILAMLLCFLLAGLARTRRQRVLVGVPLAGMILFLVLQAVGCGGGSSQPPPPPPPTGTLAGTYVITVTGTSASSNTTHTATLQLIVN
ncbi:MAG: IPT/TIG domain-containing protein [Candidatus Acidiferrum sp.]